MWSWNLCASMIKWSLQSLGMPQSLLPSIVGRAHNGVPIQSVLQLTLIGIYDKEIQAPEMCMYHALFFFLLHSHVA